MIQARFFKFFAICLALLLLISTQAFARRGGVKITNNNRSNIIEISDSLACFFKPNRAFSVPGKIKTKGSNEYFIPRKQIINNKLKKLRERNRSEAFVKTRKQKLVRQMKKLRADCDSYRVIRNSVNAILDTPSDPDAALDNFLELMAELINGKSNLTDEYIEKLSILLSVFTEKDDFDNLSLIMQNAESIRELDSNSTSGVSIRAVECSEPATNMYFVPSVNVDIFTSFLQAAEFREQFLQDNPTAVSDLAFRVWFTKSGLPSTIGGEICQLFTGIAASATPQSDNSDNIDLLPTNMQRLARAYDSAFQNCLAAYGINANAVQSLSEWRTDAKNFSPEAAEITALKNQITLDIQSGRKLILVGHSQGNKLLESAVDSLGSDGDGDFKDVVGLLAVAPAFTFSNSNDYGAFSYYLMTGDLTTAISGTPVANSTNDLSSDTNITAETHRFAQNDFILSYLRDETTASNIFTKIAEIADTLENPREFLGQGFFQVSLSWDIAGDIDLHLYEPNGSHVFWSDKIGVVGQLDRDDIPGDGPENYFVCNKSNLESGTYTVKVNNYAGDADTVATITARGKFTTNTYTVEMDAASAGSVLQDVVEIEYAEDGSFTFTDTRDAEDIP